MTDKEVQILAKEIAGYLSSHSNAADTVEGITNWWLTSAKGQANQSQVQKALDYLVASGRVEKKEVGKGALVYRKRLAGK
jgi:hypothetical protein